MEKYLTEKGTELIKYLVRYPDTWLDAGTLWTATQLDKFIRGEDVPRIYLELLVEFGCLKPELLQDMDLEEAYRKIKEYGAECIRESGLTSVEREDAMISLWDEDEED